ncbi:hypothetical protein SAMN04488038_111116 [Solimonas aquatica]|uniref:Lipoprotein n=1 Tax=Solimonas aquatica TaxID=489703 RepID=A0A1H9JDB4_9GAMM|nr:hypothetical protein [Solimonas aquatica]SEQ84904.1 hypothetical protein SAMN04488038_111116 [Solimonas aquatica]
MKKLIFGALGASLLSAVCVANAAPRVHYADYGAQRDAVHDNVQTRRDDRQDAYARHQALRQDVRERSVDTLQDNSAARRDLRQSYRGEFRDAPTARDKADVAQGYAYDRTQLARDNARASYGTHRDNMSQAAATGRADYQQWHSTNQGNRQRLRDAR